jgi:uncharacterized iron-regulated membrane protein
MDKEETNAGVSYERKDIRLRLVIGLLAGAGCLVAVVLFAIWQFYWMEENSQEKAKGSTEALAPVLPPDPRLEQIDKLAAAEYSNIDKRLAAQEAALNSSGPSDEKGFVHIPIQQAIEAVADKLPVRKQPPGHAASNAGESSSGRMIRGEAR